MDFRHRFHAFAGLHELFVELPIGALPHGLHAQYAGHELQAVADAMIRLAQQHLLPLRRQRRRFRPLRRRVDTRANCRSRRIRHENARPAREDPWTVMWQWLFMAAVRGLGTSRSAFDQFFGPC